MIRRPPRSTRTDTLFPSTTLFRSVHHGALHRRAAGLLEHQQLPVDRAAAVDVPQVPAAQGGPGEVTDAAPDDDHAERARKLFAGPIAFLKSAPALQHLPAPTVPEIAFAGRSNVGKSSLLNALTHRNGLARTSVTPGRTQELNYFDVGAPLVFRLVDMPGYGFAKAPKDVVKKWRFLEIGSAHV